MENLMVRSETSRKNFYVLMVAIISFIFLLGFSLYKYLVLHIFQPLEMMAELLVLFVLIERMAAQYSYEMTPKGLCLTKRSLLGTVTHEIPYGAIFSVYRYKPQLIGLIKFRRTYRFHSALDGRDVWTLAYTVTRSNNKEEKRRIYFKPGDQMLAALQAKLPAKVMAH
ncbi:hypothetical protein HSX37_07220|uniref:Uncharacterized protein n=1 Tax=Dendrosporobacter quercicolus TaxID=146817 RepID=A0A1G9VPX0_9FIRM|nr:hypothetical protein [Dendrosporobacter quercicolus]NSL47835.1 hypothetical protein [Dendrosporobacter quercicolus DSM 1736]SDM74239.1 hypothetical protein SAMN04488502_1074 [Dendrosporobacter quercicolus]